MNFEPYHKRFTNQMLVAHPFHRPFEIFVLQHISTTTHYILHTKVFIETINHTKKLLNHRYYIDDKANHINLQPDTDFQPRTLRIVDHPTRPPKHTSISTDNT